MRTTKHFFLVEGRRVKVKRLCKKSPDIPTQKEPSFDFDSYYIKIKIFFSKKVKQPNPALLCASSQLRKKEQNCRSSFS
ncbi:hypothetical protein [uncultured Desulfovibrio sp.]|uniref:hypothetical protein n=1 Tax=uncultured Desulfovibrio sp. TaxID=167968 RepID=UPI00261452AA|nr:hypothetical protein [uncultured Desulfovibrio sp.]